MLGYCKGPCRSNDSFTQVNEVWSCDSCGTQTTSVSPRRAWNGRRMVEDTDNPHSLRVNPNANRAGMSHRHVKNFYAEGHQVFQAPGCPTVYNRGDEQRALEACGLDPDDGHTPLKNDEGHDIF